MNDNIKLFNKGFSSSVFSESDYEQVLFDFYINQPISNLISEYKRYSNNTSDFSCVQAYSLVQAVAAKFYAVFCQSDEL